MIVAAVTAEDAGKKEAASTEGKVAQGANNGANEDDDDDDDDEEDEDNALPSSPDVLHAFVFAGSAEKRTLLARE